MDNDIHGYSPEQLPEQDYDSIEEIYHQHQYYEHVNDNYIDFNSEIEIGQLDDIDMNYPISNSHYDIEIIEIPTKITDYSVIDSNILEEHFPSYQPNVDVITTDYHWLLTSNEHITIIFTMLLLFLIIFLIIIILPFNKDLEAMHNKWNSYFTKKKKKNIIQHSDKDKENDLDFNRMSFRKIISRIDTYLIDNTTHYHPYMLLDSTKVYEILGVLEIGTATLISKLSSNHVEISTEIDLTADDIDEIDIASTAAEATSSRTNTTTTNVLGEVWKEDIERILSRLDTLGEMTSVSHHHHHSRRMNSSHNSARSGGVFSKVITPHIEDRLEQCQINRELFYIKSDLSIVKEGLVALLCMNELKHFKDVIIRLKKAIQSNEMNLLLDSIVLTEVFQSTRSSKSPSVVATPNITAQTTVSFTAPRNGSDSLLSYYYEIAAQRLEELYYQEEQRLHLSAQQKSIEMHVEIKNTFDTLSQAFSPDAQLHMSGKNPSLTIAAETTTTINTRDYQHSNSSLIVADDNSNSISGRIEDSFTTENEESTTAIGMNGDDDRSLIQDDNSAALHIEIPGMINNNKYMHNNCGTVNSNFNSHINDSFQNEGLQTIESSHSAIYSPSIQTHSVISQNPIMSSLWALESMRIRRDVNSDIQKQLEKLQQRRVDRKTQSRDKAERLCEDRTKEIRKSKCFLENLRDLRKVMNIYKSKQLITREVYQESAFENTERALKAEFIKTKELQYHHDYLWFRTLYLLIGIAYFYEVLLPIIYPYHHRSYFNAYASTDERGGGDGMQGSRLSRLYHLFLSGCRGLCQYLTCEHNSVSPVIVPTHSAAALQISPLWPPHYLTIADDYSFALHFFIDPCYEYLLSSYQQLMLVPKSTILHNDQQESSNIATSATSTPSSYTGTSSSTTTNAMTMTYWLLTSPVYWLLSSSSAVNSMNIITSMELVIANASQVFSCLFYLLCRYIPLQIISSTLKFIGLSSIAIRVSWFLFFVNFGDILLYWLLGPLRPLLILYTTHTLCYIILCQCDSTRLRWCIQPYYYLTNIPFTPQPLGRQQSHHQSCNIRNLVLYGLYPLLLVISTRCCIVWLSSSSSSH